MSYVIPILGAVVSIGGSAAINWFTRVRGASIYVRLLTPPSKWSIAWMRFDDVRGVAYLGDHNNADNLYFRTSFLVAVGNSGPRSGVLIGLRVLINGLQAPWMVPDSMSADDPQTVAPGGEDTSPLTIELQCPRRALSEGLRLMRTTPPDLVARVAYRRHVWSRDQLKRTKSFTLSGQDIRRELLAAARPLQINLDWYEQSEAFTESLREALAPVELSEDEMDSLQGALKWTADRPAADTLVQVQGEDGSAKLILKDEGGTRGAELAADGRRSTLDHIGAAYQVVATRLREVIKAPSSWASLGNQDATSQAAAGTGLPRR